MNLLSKRRLFSTSNHIMRDQSKSKGTVPIM
uniref:Uncharacterized protein n=1 Tax=Anguilla anguilla TaxID=7936 RepID=A0A0E9TYF7_ANGAN